MKTTMNVSIIIRPEYAPGFKSIDLYNKLKPYNVNITDLGDKVYLFAIIDIRDDAIETIISTCKKCGECDIEAYMVDDKAP